MVRHLATNWNSTLHTLEELREFLKAYDSQSKLTPRTHRIDNALQ
jgi:hypothetical protein